MLASLMRKLVVCIVVSTVCVVGLAVLPASQGVVSAAHEQGDHPDWIHEENHTVKPTSHQPGEESGLAMWASIPEDSRYGDGLSEVGFAANWAPAAFSEGATSEDEAPCRFDDIKTGGIDRGANLSGTQIDESVVSNVKSFWIEQNDAGQTYIMVEAYQKEDFGGEHFHLNYTDQVVVETSECFTNPEETGWYRVGSYLNGTTWQGEFIEGAGYSHYFYICECEDRAEAIEQLGEPPVTGYGHEGSRVRAEPDELDGQAPQEGWDLQSMRTPGGSGGTSTVEGTPDGPTPTDAGDVSTPTATADATTQTDDTPAGTATATAASSDDPASTTAVDGQGDGPGDGPAGETTPSADGPGLGTVTTLTALLVCSLLLSRRR